MIFWYTCPGCGETYKLRQAVTLKQRRCPRCGFIIHKEEVLEQDAVQQEEVRRQMHEARLRSITTACVGGGIFFVLMGFCTLGMARDASIGVAVLPFVCAVVFFWLARRAAKQK